MIEIVNLATIENKGELEDIILQVQFIFFASSSLKEFSSPERKEAFFKRWCGDYITLFPEQFLIMRENGAGTQVLGYLSGCKDSESAQKYIEIPGFSVFSDLFKLYPAHFHINFHPDCRGRGLGSQLVEKYRDYLYKEKNVTGVHIVTSTDAANIQFYRRLGFNCEIQRDFKQMTLLFMGKILD